MRGVGPSPACSSIRGALHGRATRPSCRAASRATRRRRRSTACSTKSRHAASTVSPPPSGASSPRRAARCATTLNTIVKPSRPVPPGLRDGRALVSGEAGSQIGAGRLMLVNLVPEVLAILAAPDPTAAYHEDLERHKPVLHSYWHNYVLDPTSPHAEQVVAAALRARRADLELPLEDVDVAAIAEDALQRSLERFGAGS